MLAMEHVQHVCVFVAGASFGFAFGYVIWRRRTSPGKIDDDNVQVFYENEVMNSKEYRMIIGVRNDLKMQKGKVAAQCAHAAVAAYVKAMRRAPNALKRWIKYGQAKITVKLDDEVQMMLLKHAAKEVNVLTSVIQDAGHTQVAPGTCTVIAFGPAPKTVLDQLTGHLKLY